MPRHKIFTYQSESIRRRDRYFRKPNANLNNLSMKNDGIILRDAHKCVLNIIPRIFNSFDCELVDLQ